MSTPRIDNLEAASYRGMATRNLIMNGNFDFWQRAVTLTHLFNETKRAADRWTLDAWGGGSHNVTMARVAEVPTLAESGFYSTYSLKLTNNNATGSAVTLRQCIEGYDYQAIHASKVRFQFWVRSSLTGIYSVAFNNYNGPSNRYYLTTYTVAAANTWQKIAIDVELDNTTSWLFDNTGGLNVMFGLGIPTTVSIGKSILNSWQNGDGRTYMSNNAWATTLNATWQIAQVQLIPGDFAGTTANIPFFRAGRNTQDELAMCQRYYEKSYDIDTLPAAVTGVGQVYVGCRANSATNIDPGPQVTFKVTKRITPTTYTFFASTGATGWAWNNGAQVANPTGVDADGQSGFGTHYTGSAGLTLGLSYIVRGHWTADAEF